MHIKIPAVLCRLAFFNRLVLLIPKIRTYPGIQMVFFNMPFFRQTIKAQMSGMKSTNENETKLAIVESLQLFASTMKRWKWSISSRNRNSQAFISWRKKAHAVGNRLTYIPKTKKNGCVSLWICQLNCKINIIDCQCFVCGCQALIR